MGLGKTVQVAVALSLLIPKSRNGRALIIVPASLRINWEKEIERWAPNLSVRRLMGDKDERFANYCLPINVLIASYDQIRQDALPLSNTVHFDVVVLDEAQKMKGMIPAQQQTVVDQVEVGGVTTTEEVEEVTENAKKGKKYFELRLRLGESQNKVLNKYAQNEGMKREDAAQSLILEALDGRGLLEDEE